jgi:indolepyruvate decarboxylase
LGLFDAIIASDIKYVGNCNGLFIFPFLFYFLPFPQTTLFISLATELNSGYAADGYARLKGLGALAVTYAVGELNALNAIAGSFAERVPVVLIVGVPTTEALKTQPLLHHTLGKYEKTLKIFEHITVAQTILDSEGLKQTFASIFLVFFF